MCQILGILIQLIFLLNIISYNMSILQLLMLLIAGVMLGSQCRVVPCPSTLQFQTCIQCDQYTPLSEIKCTCDDDSFSVMGRCFPLQYPCAVFLISMINVPYLPQFNIWEFVIAPFWTQKFSDALNNTSQPNPLPDILNNYNFAQMGPTLVRGWASAYFMYNSYINQIQSLPSSKQSEYLFEAAVLMENLLGTPNEQKWINLTNFVNQKFNQSFTSSTLFAQTVPRIIELIPCHICHDKYGIIFGDYFTTCSKCPPRCSFCMFDTTSCWFCQAGAYMTEAGTCQPCGFSNCNTCSQTRCVYCNDGYTLVDGQCTNCQGDCTTCVDGSPVICKSCASAFYGIIPDDYGQCVTCALQCVACDPTDAGTCIECSNFYYLNQFKGVCYPCQQNCLNCTSSTDCVECIYGYGLINGTCVDCILPGCLSCNDNAQVCTLCAAKNFYFDYKTSSCELTNISSRQKQGYLPYNIACRPGCDYCYNEDTSKCFRCQERYFVYDQYYCQKCMPGCLQCLDGASCFAAQSGYVVVNNMIEKCPNDCRECNPNNISQCLDCRQGYKLVSTVCVANNKPECLFFDDSQPQFCRVCMPGYTLTAAKICIQCVSGCKWTCNPTNISQCRRTRFDMINWPLYQHRLGKEGCRIQIQGNCLYPEEGYEIVKNNATNMFEVILECLYPCATCNSTACFSCEDGYTFSNGRCTVNFSCNPNCTQCVAGSERNPANNFCMACPVENCSSCQNGVCFECFEGFFFNGTACVKCPQKCRVCYDAENCKICAVGYLWPSQFRDYAYDCVKCSDNCKTCNYQPNICIQCHPGLKLVNFRCRKQYHLDFTYTLDYDYASFVVNMKSQILIGFFMRALGVGYEDIFISSIKSGSTIVSGEISGINEDSARNLYNKLKATELTDFKVKGYSISFMNDEYTVTCVSSGATQCPTGTEELSLGAFIGIAIGCIAAVLMVAIGVACLFVKLEPSQPIPKATAKTVGNEASHEGLESGVQTGSQLIKDSNL